MTTPFVAVFRSTVITIFPKALWRIMEERKRLSDSGLFDLWEHACLLYHNFEWQSAADTFAYLAKVSSDPIDQRIFVLNRGLIEARLGDFDLASVSFEKALLLDGDDPVAHFLLGDFLLMCSTTEPVGSILDCRGRLWKQTLNECEQHSNLGRIGLVRLH
jgi:tetratricopeptide (TPR) repeat protein